MSINNVSFGRVTAVTGKSNKVNKLNKKLHSQVQEGSVMMKDVTDYYKNAASGGVLAQSAQNGDKVEIYITGNDIEKVRNNENDWKSIEGILSNLDAYFSIEKLYMGDIIKKIFND